MKSTFGLPVGGAAAEGAMAEMARTRRRSGMGIRIAVKTTGITASLISRRLCHRERGEEGAQLGDSRSVRRVGGEVREFARIGIVIVKRDLAAGPLGKRPSLRAHAP